MVRQHIRIELPFGYARVTLNNTYLFIAYFNGVDTLIWSKWFIVMPADYYRGGWVMDALMPVVEKFAPKGKR